MRAQVAAQHPPEPELSHALAPVLAAHLRQLGIKRIEEAGARLLFSDALIFQLPQLIVLILRIEVKALFLAERGAQAAICMVEVGHVDPQRFDVDVDLLLVGAGLARKAADEQVLHRPIIRVEDSRHAVQIRLDRHRAARVAAEEPDGDRHGPAKRPPRALLHLGFHLLTELCFASIAALSGCPVVAPPEQRPLKGELEGSIKPVEGCEAIGEVSVQWHNSIRPSKQER